MADRASLRRLALALALAAGAAVAGPPAAAPEEAPEEAPAEAARRVFFVRSIGGDDDNDGLSAATAWRSLSRLARLEDGDSAYVGPGLYRQEIIVLRKRGVTLVADPEGRFTGDPPGVVMLAGSEPLDPQIFEPHGPPGVYRAEFAEFAPSGIVEMQGDQYRYMRARSTKEHLREGLSLLEVVGRLPATYHYDDDSRTLYLHTSDGRPPAEHELEVIRRGAGVSVVDSPSTTVVGFTIRHVGDGGIIFGGGSDRGVAVGNRVWGSRQGVRANGASGVLVTGNTLFRNENSGVYYLREAVDGSAVGNVLYENLHGLRWSSQSGRGLASGNVAFDNQQTGISIENVAGARLIGNTLAGNRRTQLLALASDWVGENNCFETGATSELVAEFSFSDRFPTLAGYRGASGRDLSSREGDCGPLPDRLDVGLLHSEAAAYAGRAQPSLEASAPSAPPEAED